MNTLEKIRLLGDSVSRTQIESLKSALGDEMYRMLDSAFESETEDEASERVRAFISEAKRSPLKLIKARKILNNEQKSIIIDFLEKNEIS